MCCTKGYETVRIFLPLVMACLFIPGLLGAQDLPAPAAKSGFRETAGKTMGTFTVQSLAGSSIGSEALAGTPTLFHVWSASKDPSGEALALVAALRHAMPGAAIFVLSMESAQRLGSAASRAGIAPAALAAGAGAAIRAVGSPVAPAWVFVDAGFQVKAYKLGRLEPGTGMEAVRSLFDTAAPAPHPVPAGQGTAKQPEASSRLAASLNAGVTDSSFAQAIELEILAELNIARTQPAAYAEILREYRSFIRGTYLERPGEVTVVLNEGAKAVDEAIAFLSRQKGIPPLSLSKGLSMAARDHARDQGKTGQTGHGGSDRSTMGQRIGRYGAWEKTAGENIAYGGESARDVVIQLIVDDGVASRGHRGNIFNANFLVVGIAFGTHPGYRTVCVQDFAGAYREK
jgi:uncharacterized protein YkwD